MWNACRSVADRWPVEEEQCVMSKGRRQTRGYERRTRLMCVLHAFIVRHLLRMMRMRERQMLSICG